MISGHSDHFGRRAPVVDGCEMASMIRRAAQLDRPPALADFTRFFSEFSLDFADETLKRHRLVATLDKRQALWELAEAA